MPYCHLGRFSVIHTFMYLSWRGLARLTGFAMRGDQRLVYRVAALQTAYITSQLGRSAGGTFAIVVGLSAVQI